MRLTPKLLGQVELQAICGRVSDELARRTGSSHIPSARVPFPLRDRVALLRHIAALEKGDKADV